MQYYQIIMSANQEIMNDSKKLGEFINELEKKHNIKFIGLEFDGIIFQPDEEYKCEVCKCRCTKLYVAEIDECETNICFDCLEKMECCEMCSLPTDAEEWYDGKSFILYCLICYVRNEKIIVGKYGNIKKSEN